MACTKIDINFEMGITKNNSKVKYIVNFCILIEKILVPPSNLIKYYKYIIKIRRSLY